MRIIRSVRQMRSLARRFEAQGKTIGFVPTMGALHGGHLSLIRRARRENDVMAVSIFVNPKQFGPQEDYLRYPRPFGRDKSICRAAGVDVIFAPAAGEMYPPEHRTYVAVEEMSDVLCGRFRHGHFKGVATVVLKLFNIVRPSRAYFGTKDYQQLKIIERMTADLNLPVKVVPCPIVREPSGLALSSRNRYLSGKERFESGRIFAALQRAGDLIQYRKLRNIEKIREIIALSIGEIPKSKLEYIAIIDPKNLLPLAHARPPLVIAVAVRVGKARLIDNILVE